MKKAGTCPAFVSDRSGLLLVHLVGRLLLAVLLLAVFLLAVLLVHLLFHLAFRFLAHLVGFLVLRERGEARGRKHRRDEDCNKLLHVIPSLVGCLERPAPRRSPLCITREL